MAAKLRRCLRNETLKNAFKSFFVPHISDKYHVLAFRCLWDVNEEDLTAARLNIFAKRKQLEEIVNSLPTIVLYVSCLCAMDSAYLRRKEFEKKQQISSNNAIEGSDTDNDYESYSQDKLIIPGKKFIICC